MKKYLLFSVLILSVAYLNPIKAQSNFVLKNNLAHQKINFKLNSNLIIIPIEINGKELSFILDSGVSTTVLFNLMPSDSLVLKNVEKIVLQGLGEGDNVEALLSKSNHFRIKNIQNNNQNLYIVINAKIDLSAKLGETIHGIIGYDLLKDFIVKIDYSKKQIHFYDPSKYEYKECKKCETFELEINKNKPYVNANVSIFENQELFPVKLLIDSGGSDALWLFENSKSEIQCPPLNFIDYLGEGLSGSIFGKRSRINRFKLGNFEFKEPTASFPDSSSVAFVKTFKERNGSIGGKILKRFQVILDYPNNKISLKKNKDFNEPFNYNMSGIDLVYQGQKLVREKEVTTFKVERDDGYAARGNEIILSYDYKFKFVPSYKINFVRGDSPAFEAGLMKDDVLIMINGEPAYKYKIEEIIYFFYLNENDKIKLEIERNGMPLKFEFRLRRMF
ncbi:MAG: aspartyl protease family protein [Flavobacteriaceae bacterium]|nr:aspartyl protease family protein [Flavobacteriaceae bacterium]